MRCRGRHRTSLLGFLASSRNLNGNFPSGEALSRETPTYGSQMGIWKLKQRMVISRMLLSDRNDKNDTNYMESMNAHVDMYADDLCLCILAIFRITPDFSYCSSLSSMKYVLSAPMV